MVKEVALIAIKIHKKYLQKTVQSFFFMESFLAFFLNNNILIFIFFITSNLNIIVALRIQKTVF